MDGFDGMAGLTAADTGEVIPLLGIDVKARVSGRAARTMVVQRFRNGGAKPVEAQYRFPLPERAAVTGFRIERDGRTFTGTVSEREKAFADYDDAIARSDGAYLLESERPNLFTASVGNLPPGAEALVTVEYVEVLDRGPDGIEYVFPTAVAERYVPPASSWERDGRPSADVVGQEYAERVPYGIRIVLSVDGRDGIKAITASRSVTVDFSSDPVTARLAFENEAPDGDIRFIIEPKDGSGAPSATALRAADEDFLMVEWTPPTVDEGGGRDIMFLLDCSGSMQGSRIEQAKRALTACVAALEPGDRFGMVRFGSSLDRPWAGFKPVDDAALETARKLIASIQADLGGTELMAALSEAFSTWGQSSALISAPGSTPVSEAGAVRSRSVVLITDGEVSDEDRIFAAIRQERRGARLFVAGIGEAPNDHLGRGCARAGAGACEFIRHGERIEAKAAHLFGLTRMTPVSGLSIEAGPGWVLAPSDPAAVPGRPLVVFVRRIRSGTELEVVTPPIVELKAAVGKRALSVEAPVTPASDGSALPQLWARERVRELEEGGTGSLQGRSNARRDSEIVDLCERYGVVSTLAAFVCIEERAVKTAGGDMEFVRIPGLRPRDECEAEPPCAAPMPKFAGKIGRKRGMPPTPSAVLSAGVLLEPSLSVQEASNQSYRLYMRASTPPVDADPLMDALSLQKAAGGFGWEAADTLWGGKAPRPKGVDAKDLPKSWTTATAAATALVLAALAARYGSRKDEWEPLVGKTAKAFAAWLSGPGANATADGLPLTEWAEATARII